MARKKRAKNEGENKPRVLVILGPTASGKTALGVRLARQLKGEIISADSRQVYRGLDIGTGKDLAEYRTSGLSVSYHLIDIISPAEKFDLAQYQALALKAITGILKKGRLPIIVGGSGLYLQALVDNYNLGGAQPNLVKRAERENRSASMLFVELQKIKPEFALRLNNSDKNNPRRLIRYLEISEAVAAPFKNLESPYNFLILGIKFPDKIMRTRVTYRLLERLEKQGLIAEVAGLHRSGLSWERLRSFGLEYKFISQHLQGELSYNEMVDKLSIATYRFTKRQKVWFKRWEKQGRKIYWLKNQAEAEKRIKEWL